MASYSSPDTVTQSTTQDSSTYTTVNMDLQKLISGDGDEYLDPLVKQVHDNTERKVENLKAEKNQFTYRNGKLVAAGFPYHIHYTKDLVEVFMTEAVHSPNSKILIPISNDVSNFTYYNTLNKQEILKLKSKFNPPKNSDYGKGSYLRYFASQANDDNEPPIEVSKDDFETSSLYVYARVRWYISGKKGLVYSKNIQEIQKASFRIPNIRKVLSPFQFYSFSNDSNISDSEKLERIINGSCSLGDQYKSKVACENAGGIWQFGSMSNHLMDLSNYDTINRSDVDSVIRDNGGNSFNDDGTNNEGLDFDANGLDFPADRIC